jgi:hypothetical protein
MRMALFSRWPRLRPKFPAPELIAADRAARYPALAADLATVAEVVGPAFSEHDLNALAAQNNYWRQQVTLIVVTALTTAFGAVEAAYRHQIWPGIVVGVLGVLSAAVAGLGEERSAQRTFLDQRSKAERLRGLAFAYLAELPPFAGADRRVKLANSVTDIGDGREPA